MPIKTVPTTKRMRYFCLHCGKQCHTSPSHFRQYCSIKCSTRHQMLHGFVTVWKGGLRQLKDGRWVKRIYKAGSVRGRYVYEHDTIAEKALGRPLPRGAVVHHVNLNHADNTPSNLVICQDQAYHLLLHTRTAIVFRGGNPNLEKICSRCQEIKLHSAFPAKRRCWDKLYPYCRACVRIIGHESHKRKRLGKPNLREKLNRAAVTEIRRAIRHGSATYDTLATEYHVHVNTIRDAACGRRWRSVPEPVIEFSKAVNSATA